MRIRRKDLAKIIQEELRRVIIEGEEYPETLHAGLSTLPGQMNAFKIDNMDAKGIVRVSIKMKEWPEYNRASQVDILKDSSIKDETFRKNLIRKIKRIMFDKSVGDGDYSFKFGRGH